jgi:hypothetical protein
MRSIKMSAEHSVDVVSTPNEWELYTASMDCTEAGAALNAAVDECAAAIRAEAAAGRDVGKRLLRKLRGAVMEPVQEKYREYGAGDSEPDYHVAETLRRLACAAMGCEVQYSRWD